MDNRQQPAMDWQQFQRSLLNQMPFIGSDKKVKSIDRFVQKAILNSLPKGVNYEPDFHPHAGDSLEHELFETHRAIFVRCRIPEHMSLKNVRLFANKRKLKMEYRDSSEEIVLPSDVNSNRTAARFRNGILEIRMPKLSESEPYREIFIQE